MPSCKLVEMGGRQSQEPSAAPLDVAPPSLSTSITHNHVLPSHRHSSTHQHTPPSSYRHQPPSSHEDSPPRLPTLSDYPHLRLAPRAHSAGQSSSSRLQPPQPARPSSQVSAERLLELNIALATLQERLQARAEAQGRYPHSTLHPASFPSGLPLLFFRPVSTVQCPVCSKDVPSSEMETHMPQCVNRPRVTYNVDTLAQDSGECSICLDDMLPGEQIVRLPCLCVYHLKCAQQWFKVSQTCPEHPDLA
jgi:E3 ubiquitin-protein ligase ZNRF1/2